MGVDGMKCVSEKQLIVEHQTVYRCGLTSAPEAPMSPKRPKRVALYLRVSTSEQTTRNQRRELHAIAERHGWHVVATYEDAGVSGANGRDKRPGFDRLMMAVARREIDMVAAWSVDRLGRSLTDLLSFLTDLHAKGVDLFLHQQGLDTSTPLRPSHVPDARCLRGVRAGNDTRARDGGVSPCSC
jgi:predicted site-specific integrase-resolvase